MLNERTLVLTRQIREKNTFQGLIQLIFFTAILVLASTTHVFAIDESVEQHEYKDSLTILGLMSAAQEDMEAGYLTEPEGDNAFEKVKAILNEDPDHLGAARILSDILKKHTQSLQDALNNQDTAGAKKYLQEIRKINPEAIAISDAEKQLEKQLKTTAPVVNATTKKDAIVGEIVAIPGGTFLMGTFSGRNDEKPQHLVSVPSFEIAKYEVTVAQFRKFIEATNYVTDAERDAGGDEGCYADGGGVDFGWKIGLSWHNPGFKQTEDHPVICVSWNDAQEYISWLNKETGLNYSLASEAKWEYAARSKSSSNYHFGDDRSELCKYANLYDEVGQTINKYGWRHAKCNDGEAKTATVGQYEANAFGLHDMHGNVWEWVGDCWQAGYHDAPSNGDLYDKESCELRVTRGGSWYNIPSGVRSANRYWYKVTFRSFNVGFRIFKAL